MKKGQIINGYLMLHDFTNAGGGMSKWTFASKGGEEFFFKEFLTPTYPTEGSPGSEKTKAAKRNRCAAFEKHQNSIVSALKSKCARGGNVIFAREFFRSGAKYYKVTDKVDVSSLAVEDIARLPLENRVLILKTVVHSLGVLHKCGIVHGDLKPNNLLIKQSEHEKTVYIAKLIDFDASFFVGKPPELAEDLIGDLLFYSPEAVSYVRGDESSRPSDLGLACDIFALGIIYCLYLTGEYPVFDQETYQYPGVAAHNGERVYIRPGATNPVLEALINEMLLNDPASRPTAQDVFERLKTYDKTPLTKPAPTSAKTSSVETLPGGSRLRGSLLSKVSGTSVAPPSSAAPPPFDSVETTEARSESPAKDSTSAPDVPGESRLKGKLLIPRT